MENYPSQNYEQSFQTVPSSVPETPSPEQWSTDLSPHSSGGSSCSTTASNITNSPHQSSHHGHHQQANNHLNHTHHQAYAGMQPSRDHHYRRRHHLSLSHINPMQNPISSHPNHVNNDINSTGSDVKPVVQAATLAGLYLY